LNSDATSKPLLTFVSADQSRDGAMTCSVGYCPEFDLFARDDASFQYFSKSFLEANPGAKAIINNPQTAAFISFNEAGSLPFYRFTIGVHTRLCART
jgi:hypothetical protein